MLTYFYHMMILSLLRCVGTSRVENTYKDTDLCISDCEIISCMRVPGIDF